jgi:hypothetical protein
VTSLDARTTLLNQPVDATQPRAPQHVRSVTHVVPQPVMVPQAQPQVVYAAPATGGAGTAVGSILLALIVVLVGAVALVGAYYVTKQAAPSAREAAVTRGTAMREGFRAGQSRGTVDGRDQALANAESSIALRTATARQQAYAAAYRRGERAGRNSYHPRTYSGYRGYRGTGYSFPNRGLYSALGTAQALANATGAPVDVEVY